MAPNTLATIYARDLLNQALITESVRKSVVWNSGLVATDPALSELVGQGEGRKMNRVGYNHIPNPLTTGNAAQATTHNPGYMDDSSTKLIPNASSVYEYDAVKCMVAYGLGEKEIIKAVNFLDDPVTALGGKMTDYWATFFDYYAIYQLLGVFNNNIASDSSDMIFGDGTDVADEDILIDGWGTMGDAAEMAGGVLVCHSLVAKKLRKLQLIDSIPSATNPAVSFEYFQQARMLVSDETPTYTNGTNDTCLSILAYPGVMEFGQSTNNIIPSEVHRDPTEGVGAGESQLITRQQFSMSTVGHSWKDAVVSGSVAAGAIGGSGGTKLFPSIADQAAATNWARVLDRKSVRIAYVHTSEIPA